MAWLVHVERTPSTSVRFFALWRPYRRRRLAAAHRPLRRRARAATLSPSQCAAYAVLQLHGTCLIWHRMRCAGVRVRPVTESKGLERQSDSISRARCPHAPLSLSHAVSAAPEVASGTMVMWLVAGCMAMPMNPHKAPEVLHLGGSRGRVVVQTVAVAQQRERYRHNIRWWTSSPPHHGCAQPLPSSTSTNMRRTTTARSQHGSCRCTR